MKIIELLKLQDPDGFLAEHRVVYEAMRTVAERTNDLRAYLLADAMLEALALATSMLALKRSRRHYYYTVDPQLHVMDLQAAPAELMQFRLKFHYSPGGTA